MASYQARQRDPFLDQNTQAAIERRGKELLGAVLLILAALTGLMLISYSPDDPSWLASTDEPAQNLLGRYGAAIASPLFVIAGYASWGFAVVFAAWGLRFMAHIGEERVFGRAIFSPIAVALLAVYASTHVAGDGWSHSFGLGGLFGDTVLGAILGVAPVSAAFGLKVMSVLVGISALAMAFFVLGFDTRELRATGRFLLIGTIVTYDWVLRLLGASAVGSLRLAQNLQDQRRARREAAAEAAEEAAAWAEAERSALVRSAAHAAPARVLRAEPRFAGDRAGAMPAEPIRENRGLLGRVPGLLRRAVDPVGVPEPELVERQLPHGTWAKSAPSEDHIRARIADVMKSRGLTGNPDPAARAEPPMSAAKRGLRAAFGLGAAAARPAVAEPVLTATPRFMPGTRAMAPQTDAQASPATDPLTDDPDADFDRNAFADLDRDEEDDTTALTLHHGTGAAGPKALVQHNARRPAPSRQAMAEAQPKLKFDETASDYETPPLSLLSSPATVQRHQLSDEALEENARMLESVLDDYGVKGEITSVRPGPVVTMYELEPAPGLKASRVIGLADDIARSMSALSARVSTVPGRTVIGIELPNSFREKVVLREILSARDFGDTSLRLPLALGKDISGEPVVANLAKMPHLLIAGTTGSGKSVA
ncbi:MAG: DNA translocase FtsK 4TM domain-containing protein, partial [Paracoccaceae bacterium]|nr:DNA translocase FtsK 4TM domain-containing protein [Paracoccaceae bacterium]